MHTAGNIFKVPTEIQIRDKLQSHDMNRRSERTEEAIYREFVESVSVSSDVMAVLVGMPEIASIAQAKEYLRQTRGTGRSASTELRGRGGLRAVTTRFWRRVLALLSQDVLGIPHHSRHPGVN